MSGYTAYFNGEWVPTSEATLSPWAEEFLAANVEEAKALGRPELAPWPYLGSDVGLMIMASMSIMSWAAAPSAWVSPVKMPTSLLIAR